MTANFVYGDARSNFIVPIMKLHTTLEYFVSHGGDGAGIEDPADLRVQHATPRAIGHLRILQVIAGAWKEIMISRMVVMHMRNHDMFDFVR